MKKLNLPFWPKISNDKPSMLQLSLRLKITISLLVALVGSYALNNVILGSAQPQNIVINEDSQIASRYMASALPRGLVSWENKAFKSLEAASERDLASVGQKPTKLDNLVFGDLEGKYLIRKINGEIFEIRYFEAGGENPQTIESREKFLKSNLTLFSSHAQSIRQIHHEDNSEVIVERYELMDQKGQGLVVIQFLLDQNQNLLAMTRL